MQQPAISFAVGLRGINIWIETSNLINIFHVIPCKIHIINLDCYEGGKKLKDMTLNILLT